MLDLIVRTKSVITKKEFKKIKRDNLLGMSYRELSKKYNHPCTTVHNYLCGKSKPNTK